MQSHGDPMKYAAIRNQIRSGDLIALTHTKWWSWRDLQIQAVRLFTESRFSHVGLAFVVGGRVWMIESVEPVVRMIPLSNLEEGFYWAPSNTSMCDAEIEFALALVGKGRYSKWEAIKAYFIAVRAIAKGNWECAKLVIYARRLSGVDLGNRATPSDVIQKSQENDAPVYFVEM